MQSTEKFKLKFKGGQTHSNTDCCMLRTARGHRVRVFLVLVRFSTCAPEERHDYLRKRQTRRTPIQSRDGFRLRVLNGKYLSHQTWVAVRSLLQNYYIARNSLERLRCVGAICAGRG